MLKPAAVCGVFGHSMVTFQTPSKRLAPLAAGAGALGAGALGERVAAAGAL
jgi:hypothetical protein